MNFGMRKCIVKGCPSRQMPGRCSREIIFHIFPKCPVKARRWLESTGQHFEDMDTLIKEVTETKRSNYRLCSTHFTVNSYEIIGSRKCLKKSAMPTIYEYTKSSAQSTLKVPKVEPIFSTDNTPSAGTSGETATAENSERFGTERKFIVYESCLDQLIGNIKCNYQGHCNGNILKFKKEVSGTLLTVRGECEHGHFTILWNSEPIKIKVL
ncbi:uncharacterized protein LOC128653884 [Bombina bombina]|uniref:uncharacterized protein LOC128653884 n=1 Tax=Bombina bombina TaxID=8345 RepID=UPI00235B0BF6|nr:uncharacterized protein LOC128653884 [Bombina bombina]